MSSVLGELDKQKGVAAYFAPKMWNRSRSVYAIYAMRPKTDKRLIFLQQCKQWETESSEIDLSHVR